MIEYVRMILLQGGVGACRMFAVWQELVPGFQFVRLEADKQRSHDQFEITMSLQTNPKTS